MKQHIILYTCTYNIHFFMHGTCIAWQKKQGEGIIIAILRGSGGRRERRVEYHMEKLYNIINNMHPGPEEGHYVTHAMYMCTHVNKCTFLPFS